MSFYWKPPYQIAPVPETETTDQHHSQQTTTRQECNHRTTQIVRNGHGGSEVGRIGNIHEQIKGLNEYDHADHEKGCVQPGKRGKPSLAPDHGASDDEDDTQHQCGKNQIDDQEGKPISEL